MHPRRTERARELLRDTNARTVWLLEAVMEGDGFADGPAFRAKYGDNALKGPIPVHYESHQARCRTRRTRAARL
ncbi:hypothetical protein [Streptomyces californicus]|uniref:hypothetical protein n=1 Tax=Streptomyces californicus TaxID=67351 RepID=UPI003408907E